ncbi:hypothetical protein K7X08_005514 [Anisodus acutangulus]|uniref:Uncharacterized protein n=1 Tax=Anisodus acutangulus TaxID=402998 RepID=A0A9Q1R7B0_9SOLA|nr:hypothetical protein K7X08_005514 [Anisodus acutangulus]
MQLESPNNEKSISRTVLGVAIHIWADELLDLCLVWHPSRISRQLVGYNGQFSWCCFSTCLHCTFCNVYREREKVQEARMDTHSLWPICN